MADCPFCNHTISCWSMFFNKAEARWIGGLLKDTTRIHCPHCEKISHISDQSLLELFVYFFGVLFLNFFLMEWVEKSFGRGAGGLIFAVMLPSSTAVMMAVWWRQWAVLKGY